MQLLHTIATALCCSCVKNTLW